MVHPHEQMLDGVDDNNIGCHMLHDNSAQTEGAMMLHVVDGGENHLIHLTQEVDCCLMERKKQKAYGECPDHQVLNVMKHRSVMYDSATLNDGKEVDVAFDDCVNDHFNGCVGSCVDVTVEDGVGGDVDG
eukprot:13989763-Ditylum_brightwellii.AAC.1